MEVDSVLTQIRCSKAVPIIHEDHPAVVYLVETMDMSATLKRLMEDIQPSNVIPRGQDTIAQLVNISNINYIHSIPSQGAQLQLGLQQLICKTLLRFFETQMSVLATLSEKHSAFKEFHFLVGPTAAVLRSLRLVLDKNITNIMSLIPNVVGGVEQGATRLDQELGDIINLYSA